MLWHPGSSTFRKTRQYQPASLYELCRQRNAQTHIKSPHPETKVPSNCNSGEYRPQLRVIWGRMRAREASYPSSPWNNTRRACPEITTWPRECLWEKRIPPEGEECEADCAFEVQWAWCQVQQKLLELLDRLGWWLTNKHGKVGQQYKVKLIYHWEYLVNG
jgi:hypothetical protein